jgi:5-methyltetrahydrofolate--homocysteine methyltransferase
MEEKQMSEILRQISQAVIDGRVDEMSGLAQSALDEGLSAQTILDEGLMTGMDYVGKEFKAGAMYVPEVLRSAKAMQTANDILKPKLAAGGSKNAGRVLLGTVKGDLHDIGKNLVGMMCEGAGFEVRDLGKDLGPEAFVDAVKKYEPDIIGMSALLTTTMRAMEQVIKALQEAGLRDKVMVMVGGAPVTQAFATQIGADGYASNAAAAADLARKLIGVKGR